MAEGWKNLTFPFSRVLLLLSVLVVALLLLLPVMPAQAEEVRVGFAEGAGAKSHDGGLPAEPVDPHKMAQNHIEFLQKVKHRNLTHEEIEVVQDRIEFEAKHKGHEEMHNEIFLILVGTIVGSQIVIYFWKQRHFKSYQAVTLFGMWLIPAYFSIRLEFLRMIFVWIVFTITTAIIAYKALQRPLPKTTPRLVYTYFFGVYRLSELLGITGYTFLFFHIFGLSEPFGLESVTSSGLVVMFYGLYYGVLVRDFAEICSDRMASSIGYISKEGMPEKEPNPTICAICGMSLSSEDHVEKEYTLSCKHKFHEFCIRGWCIVGKKQTCPFCKEKVDLKAMFPNPWEKKEVYYSQILDLVRYFVVWQPVVLTLVQFFIWELGLE